MVRHSGVIVRLARTISSGCWLLEVASMVEQEFAAAHQAPEHVFDDSRPRSARPAAAAAPGACCRSVSVG